MSSVNTHGSDSDQRETGAAKTGQQLVYFAAERTLMAWIRAALALMALGFVIDRFGLVVHATTSQFGQAIHPSALSFSTGAGLVVVGGLLALVASIRYAHFTWRYRQTGDTEPGYGLEFAILFTVIVALAGAVIAGYLMTVGY